MKKIMYKIIMIRRGFTAIMKTVKISKNVKTLSPIYLIPINFPNLSYLILSCLISSNIKFYAEKNK